MKDKWEIIDTRGTIESGTEQEMIEIWNNTVDTGKSPRITEWEGDLKLIQIHAITK